MKGSGELDSFMPLFVLGAMLIGGFSVYYVEKTILTSFISETKRKYRYEPLTLFNASLFMASNTVLWILVALPNLEGIAKFFPDVSPWNLMVAIVLFVAMRIYIFNNFRVKTNTLTAIASVLALDAFTVIMTVVVLTADLYVQEAACLPFITLLFFPGRSWSLLFSKKKR